MGIDLEASMIESPVRGTGVPSQREPSEYTTGGS
jgi:hypothetical protein